MGQIRKEYVRLLNTNGKLINRNVTKYLIKWDEGSLSQAQFKVKQFVKRYWCASICYEEFPVYGSRMKVDLVNMTKKIAIEVNGEQHSEFHYFHNGSRIKYLNQIKNDVSKSKWLKLNNFKEVIIYTKEIPELSEKFFLDKFNIVL